MFRRQNVLIYLIIALRHYANSPPLPPAGARLLQDAVRDILFLKEANNQLELKLRQAVEWELGVC